MSEKETNWQEIDENYYATSTATVETEITIKEYTMAELWEQAWSEAGKALFYMEFLHPEVDFRKQKERIKRMCYHLALEWRRHFEDTPNNRCWFANWMEKFINETENQC